MGRLSPTRVNNFCDCVSRWSNFLKVDREDSKEKNLDSGTRGIPKIGEIKSTVRSKSISKNIFGMRLVEV